MRLVYAGIYIIGVGLVKKMMEIEKRIESSVGLHILIFENFCYPEGGLS